MVVFIDYDKVLETRASCSAARKEQLCRKDTDARNDFYYFKICYMQGYATTVTIKTTF